MALEPIRIPRLAQSNPIVDGQGRASNEFIRRINEDVIQTIEDTLNGVIAAQNAADAAQADANAAQGAADSAQTTANQGVSDAATAQARADDAYDLADTKVSKNVGPTWLDATGTSARTAYASYTAPSVSNPPTQGEVQGIADEVRNISRHLVALINDGVANESLTT